MNNIPRFAEAQVKSFLQPNKVVVLLGPRRVGKTHLIRELLSEVEEPFLLLNGEDIATQELFTRRSVAALSGLLDGKKILVIDEAQKIPDIGNALKLMVDEIEGLKILVTGSSAFDVENYTGEPLTGRKWTFKLFSVSEGELDELIPVVQQKDALYQRLIYGSYPELLTMDQVRLKQRYLRELINAYLLKDILTFDTIRNSDKIIDLLRLVAFQVGSEVSIPELSNKLQIDRATVDKYLDLLTKVYVIYPVRGFSRNLRKEVTKSKKFYFLDNGIRNALIGNFRAIELRDDTGILWENYLVSERVKQQNYEEIWSYNYFWRTYDQQEIDWLEDRDGRLHAYEFKWNPRKKPRVPVGFAKAYPEAQFRVIGPDNYREWLL